MLEYINSGSVIHRLDPRSKLAFSFIMALSAVLAPSALTLFILLCITLAVLAFAGVFPTKFKLILLTMASLLLIGVATQAIFYTEMPYYSGPRTVLFNLLPWDVPVIGSLPVTAEGINYGIFFSTKMMAIVLPPLIIPFTTHPSELILMLRKMRLPEPLVLLITMSLRFIPLTLNNFTTLRNAQKLRKDKRGIKDYIMLLETLLIISLRAARQMALALECRAFGVTEKSTSLKTIKFGKRDAVFTVFSATIFVAVIFNVGA